MKKSTLRSLVKALDGIAAGQCDEIHMKCVLMDLRECAGKGSILREIAHFVAHPDVRTKGINHDNVRRMADELRELLEGRGALHVEPTFKAEEILVELKAVLSEMGLPIHVKTIDDKAHEILLCIFVLLQDATFKYLPSGVQAFLIGDQQGRLTLAVSIRRDDLGIKNPAFWKNVGLAVTLITSDLVAPDFLMVDNLKTNIRYHVEVVRDDDGKLVLKPC